LFVRACLERADWIPLSHFPDDGGASSLVDGIELRRPDIIPVISAYRAGRVARLPLVQPGMGFTSTLVEVGLFDRSGAICLIKQFKSNTNAAAPAIAPTATATVRASNWAASIAAATAAAVPSTVDSKSTVATPISAPTASSNSEFSLTAASNMASNSTIAASTSTTASTDAKSTSSTASSSALGDFWYTLPVTHVTAEETIAFAANRLMRAKFGFLVDISGVAAIEHNGRSDLKLDGTAASAHRICVSVFLICLL
jgi:hypothetical protein